MEVAGGVVGGKGIEATAEELKTANDGLMAVLQKIAEAAQAAGGAAGAAGPEGAADAGPAPDAAKEAKKADDDVVDADFEVVDEEKK